MASQSATSLRRSQSGGTLRKSGEVALATSPGSPSATQTGGAFNKTAAPGPSVPKHLSVHALTRRRKLAASTGNLHGYMAEDYHQINWPLPKMFGMEKYGYSLIDITDPRHVKDCAGMSKRLIRLAYDQQIVDLEWRKTYNALLDAEHKLATLRPREGLAEKMVNKTKEALKRDVDSAQKYLLELQEQKDLYQREIQEVYARCDAIKADLKKESELEELRLDMENRVQQGKPKGLEVETRRFNIHREKGGHWQTATGNSHKMASLAG